MEQLALMYSKLNHWLAGWLAGSLYIGLGETRDRERGKQERERRKGYAIKVAGRKKNI